MTVKKGTFQEKEIEIRKLKLKDANILLPCVMTAMFKMSIGESNYFSELKPADVELFQKMMCQYIDVYEDGEKSSLTLNEIYEGLDEFIPLLAQFVEANFGFFSKAQLLINVMIGRNIGG
jgi:hypothetical protein